MTWTITRLVGCEHIRRIQNAADTAVLNSTGPDGELTGAGRPGKQRISFIALSSDLHQVGDPDPNRSLYLLVDSGIPFQNPPLALAENVSGYQDGSPLDLSTYYPIVTVSPLNAYNAEPGASWDVKLFVQSPVVAASPALPAGLTPYNPDTDCVALILGLSAFIEGGDEPVPGAFLIEIDFSHTLAS